MENQTKNNEVKQESKDSYNIEKVKASDIVHIIKMGIMEELDIIKERISNIEVFLLASEEQDQQEMKITREQIRMNLETYHEVLKERFKEANK